MDTSKRKVFKLFLGADDALKNIPPPYFCGKYDCFECFHPCVDACERNLLSFDENLVKFEVSDAGCNFCQNCAKACESIGKEVINIKFDKNIKAKALINTNSCLAWNNTVCYNCLDLCSYDAIEYLGVFRPVINQNCTGCGECLGGCFKYCIKLKAI